MTDKSSSNASEQLVEQIVKGIEEKKGEQITTIDLRKIDNTICDFFVVCHANSNTQVKAIADSIEEQVRKNLGDKVFNKEGYENLEWVLLDYVNVVVHVFQKPFRAHYQIESLWGDAVVKHIESIY